MAHQDETTEHADAPDDWFHDPQVDDKIAAAAQSDTETQRRFTVLSDTSSDQEHGSSVEADWVDDDGTARVAPPVLYDVDNDEVAIYDDTGRHPIQAESDSFDARTARLRDHRPTAAGAVQRSWWQRHRAAVAVTTSLVVVLGGIGAAALWVTSSTDEPAAPQSLALDEIVTTTAVPTTSSGPAAAGTAAANVTWCAGQAPGEPVTEESADPGMAAIWRFEKAFYYDRDGAAARAQATPDAVLASAQRLQQGIDALEPDIEFCVLADPVSPGVYDVTVVERGPGIDGRTAAQRFTTAETGGQTLITAITQR
ncbi:hypothetical protein CH263_20345 [Rhodococcus sp. 06-1059B-a]|nr:hypothetical protein [Rhodococcus sp. 06-1059B-a]OZD60842.1 hypothetical protein CH263_20345 [Rhodococcus sp. 06-1059B-a]